MFLFAIEFLVVPIVALLFAVDLWAVGPKLFVLLALGNIGLASFGTLFGAMTARTSARELVLSTVLFPAAPALVAGVAGTRLIITAALASNPVTWNELADYMLLIGVFDAIGLLGGAGLFGLLIEDSRAERPRRNYAWEMGSMRSIPLRETTTRSLCHCGSSPRGVRR